MPHFIQEAKGTRPSTLVWWFDEKEIEKEAAIFPWLRATADPNIHLLCLLCRRLNFEYLFSKSLARIRFDGKYYIVHPDGLTIGSVSQLRKRKDKGCLFCRMIWDELCLQFSTNDLPDISGENVIEIQLRNIHIGFYGPFTPEHLDSVKEPYKFDLEISFSRSLSREEYIRRTRSDSVSISLIKSKTQHGSLRASARVVESERGPLEFKRLRKELDICKVSHGDHDGLPCPARFDFEIDEDFVTNFIDVSSLNIVTRTIKGTKYVALSYVWGSAKTLQMTTKNVEALKASGGLRKYMDETPKTIRDAVFVAQSLGFCYLWVDAICIQQDSDDKMRQVGKMDMIYAAAELTIVAASGDSADAGLPGTSPGSGLSRQRVTTLPSGMQLANTLLSYQTVVNASIWNTRGWTYQERLLSERMMIFTPEQIYFVCRHGSHAESDVLDVHDFDEHVSCLHQATLDHTVAYFEELDLSVYARTVAEYTRRNFGFPGDILNAFHGLETLLSSLFVSSLFRFCMPTEIFDLALLWIPTAPLVRRDSKEVGAVSFPSWSWAGWIGPVNYEPLYHFAECTRPLSDEQSVPVTGFGSLPAKVLPSSAQTKARSWTWTRSVSDDDENDGEIFYASDAEAPGHWHCRTARQAAACLSIIQSLGTKEDGWTLRLRTPVARFNVIGVHAPYSISRESSPGGVCKPGNHQACALEIHDAAGKRAGTVMMDGNLSTTAFQRQRGKNQADGDSGLEFRFVAISRSTWSVGDIDPAWDEKTKSYTGEPGDPAVNPQVEPDEPIEEQRLDMWFDAQVYPVDICWGLYNVLMLSDGDERIGVGKVHMYAFDRVCERDVDVCIR